MRFLIGFAFGTMLATAVATCWQLPGVIGPGVNVPGPNGQTWVCDN
jgi:hypothetical protein